MKELKSIFRTAARDGLSGCRLRIRDGSIVTMAAGALFVPFAISNLATGGFMLGLACCLPPLVEAGRCLHRGRAERLKDRPPEP